MIHRVAMDFIAQLARHRQPPHAAPIKPDVKAAAAHEGQRAHIAIAQPFDHLARLWPGQRKAHCGVGDIAQIYIGVHMIGKPAHMPFAQIVAAHDPPAAIAPVKDGQIAL